MLRELERDAPLSSPQLDCVRWLTQIAVLSEVFAQQRKFDRRKTILSV